MNLSKTEAVTLFNEWLMAWNDHDLERVMNLFHEDVIFENWTGATVIGKRALKKAWMLWFINHGNFIFTEEGVSFDAEEQRMIFMWKLEWPSHLTNYKGKNEIRHGVDILYFKDGKLIQKHTYSKTTVQIEGLPISLEN
ncbi:hypothetical protein AQPE_4747 [Aquipluma nitroreducens]|uniref:SnoaL-like domain-containing protein n=1 Tax=Aquipluma nitroreducens TaxID=2010828 RepID=A0A5K7SG75_9BACT|nr:nuclear transport factor 2 family protein [Aquipluma nitroreducens]BBE20553.1 hypothetical protein AQPE_4747 [Aquipluma nitroreducens]